MKKLKLRNILEKILKVIKKPYYQIGIKKKSKFSKPITVALVDVVKDLLIVRTDLLKRNIINRLRNVEPESSKRVAKLKELPK